MQLHKIIAIMIAVQQKLQLHIYNNHETWN